MTEAPLVGLQVLSLAEQYPGPFATLLLADLGADVVLVERPDGGDPSRQFGSFFSSLNRSKRSVALNLKDPAGKQALLDLCRDADVLLEGFRPGVMARLGLDHNAVAVEAPQLIYLSLSGFGQDGPQHLRPAHDISYQAVAGLLADWTGEAPGGSPSPHLGDLTSGMFAVIGILAALHRRSNTGLGGYLDLSMTDGLVSLLTAHLVPVVNDLGPPTFPIEPGYGVFRTADGARLALSVAHEDRFWAGLCQALDLQELMALRSPQRIEERDRLAKTLGARITEFARHDLEQRLDQHDVPYAWVNELHEVPEDPQIAARGLFVELPAENGEPEIRYVRQPLRFDGASPGPQHHAPRLGEHTRQVLAAAGYEPGTIDRLLESGAAAADSPA